jgi:hypothetical protein
VETKFGWRERLLSWFLDIALPPAKYPHVYEKGITPDHLTAIRIPIALIVFILIRFNRITRTIFLWGIVICGLSDIFDGPLSRILRQKYQIEPRPFILSRWIPVLQGVHFDGLSDKIALLVGIDAAIHFGYPWQPLLGMIFFTILRLICAFHGGWLLGLSWKDLWKTLFGHPPAGFTDKIKDYAVKANQSILEGKVEAILQACVLGTVSIWTFFPWPQLINLGYSLAAIAFVSGFIAYRLYIRRYLELNNAQINSLASVFFSQVWIDLPYQPENRGPLTLSVSRILLLIGGYWLAGPIPREI